jgi:hypothetical protein
MLALVASSYLFVTAPAALPEPGSEEGGQRIQTRTLLKICAAENAGVRKLYTSRIVGPGKDVGLSFDEDWQRPGVDAGPLPALFLRETARNLERRPEPLGLFLGSDAPISEANLFGGVQATEFAAMRAEPMPRFFFTPDLGLHTAMFPDVAIAPACVTCHNEHPNSPKDDWKLNDVMGATTWTYPSDAVTLSEALSVIDALRQSVREAYASYVEKSKSFAAPPEIGERWPTSGYYLPSTETFMQEAERSTSVDTLNRLLRRP